MATKKKTRVMYGVCFGPRCWFSSTPMKKRELFDTEREAAQLAEREGGEVKPVRVPMPSRKLCTNATQGAR